MRTVYNETCDFWSLGIIGYELITETTPFHSDNVHDTYAQILSYCDEKQKLRYDKDVTVSLELRSLLDHLVVKMDKRFSYERIVGHPFFSDVVWSKVRQQVPPIIPSVSGDNDTSNFEVKKSHRNNTYDKALSGIQGNNFAGQDLPFVGYGYVHDETFSDAASSFPELQSTTTSKSDVGRLSLQVKSLQKTVDTQVADINSLQQNLTSYQRKSAQMDSVEKILAVTREELNVLKTKLKEKTVEIASCKTQIKTLKGSLKIEEEMRVKNDANISDVLNSTYQKWERAKKLSEQNYEKQIAEKNAELMSLKQSLKGFEKELATKSDECAHLQNTVKNFEGLLKSSKSQCHNDKNEWEHKYRDACEDYERQIRELKSKLQTQVEAKHAVDDELRKTRRSVEQKTQSETIIADQKEKLSQTNRNLNDQIRREMDDNRVLRDEKARIEQQMHELEAKLDEMSRSRMPSPANAGGASVYCSLESITSAVEEQLKKDLVLAKESENEQRKRADRLEDVVKRLEAAIERMSEPNSAEVLLERKNEKLEDKLNSLREQVVVEKQASRTALLAEWKTEKQVETITFEKNQLEQKMKKLQGERDELELRIKENRLAARNREDKILELQMENRKLKTDMSTEREKWTKSEENLIATKAEVVQLNGRLHELDIELDKTLVKMRLFEQQSKSLAQENKQLLDRLRKKDETLEDTVERQKESENRYNTVSRNFEMLKKVSAVMETQLNELEAMYKAEVQKNEKNYAEIKKLLEQIRDRDLKLQKLEHELAGERAQKSSVDGKMTDLKQAYDGLCGDLDACHRLYNELQSKLTAQTDSLMGAEETLAVQKEEIQNLQRIKHSMERELVILKEENSKILTDLYMAKETIGQQTFEHNTLKENLSDVKQELEQLSGTMSEMHNYYMQREVKSEATQAQYKKLIEYLQKRVDELAQKKKKTLAEVIFGSSSNSHSKKENVPPPTPDDSKRDRTQATNKAKAQTLKTQISTPVSGSVRRIESLPAASTPAPAAATTSAPKREADASEQLHHFEMTLDDQLPTPRMCLVCNIRLVPGKSFWQCKKCKFSVHKKCRGDANMKCLESYSDLDSNDSENFADYPKDEYVGVLLREDIASPALKVNCLVEIVDNVVLMGCVSGIKAFNLNNENLIHVANIESVTCFALVSSFPKCLMIAADGKQLLQCELRHLEQRAQASVCLNTGLDYIELDLPFVNSATHDLWRFAKIYDYIDLSRPPTNDPIAIAGTMSQIVILRYSVEHKCFQAIRSLDTVKPVQSVLFTATSAIVSSNKYYEVKLSDFSYETLVESTESRRSEPHPMEAFPINRQELLLCFAEFGIFIDKHRCKSRPNDLKWLRKPNGFAYCAPFLFVSYNDGIQVIRINKSFSSELQASEDDATDADEKVLQTFIAATKPRILGKSGKHGIFTLSKANDGVDQVARIDGVKALRNALTDSLETVLSSETEV